MSRSDSRKEHGYGSALRHAQATMAGGMSGCPRALRSGNAAFGTLYGALCGDLLPPRTPPACPSLPRWLALGCGTQTCRIDRVSLRTRPSTPATLHGLGSLGGWALAPRADAPSRSALGTRRGRVGV